MCVYTSRDALPPSITVATAGLLVAVASPTSPSAFHCESRGRGDIKGHRPAATTGSAPDDRYRALPVRADVRGSAASLAAPTAPLSSRLHLPRPLCAVGE